MELCLAFCVSWGTLPVTPVICTGRTQLTNSCFFPPLSLLISEPLLQLLLHLTWCQAPVVTEGYCAFRLVHVWNVQVCVCYTLFSLILMFWHSKRQLNKAKEACKTHRDAHNTRHGGGWHTAMWSFWGSLHVHVCIKRLSQGEGDTWRETRSAGSNERRAVCLQLWGGRVGA